MEIADILNLKAPSNLDIMKAIAGLMKTNKDNYDSLNRKSTDTMEFLKNAVKEIKDDVTLINTRVDGIQHNITTTNEGVTQLQSEVNYLKQVNLQCDIYISGFPHNINDVPDILAKLNGVYNFGIENIKSSYLKTIAVKRSGRSGSGKFNQLFVKFNSLDAKNVVMSQVRTNGPLKLKQLYDTSASGDVTINIRDRLTAQNNTMMKQLLDLKRNNIIKYCWFRHNNAYIKVTDNDQPRIIWTENDVTKIKR